jgi:hypothetical protein
VPGSSTTVPDTSTTVPIQPATTVAGSSTTVSIQPGATVVSGGGGSGSAGPGSRTASGSLPRTGQGTSGPLAALGGALLLVGIALLTAAHASRHRPAHLRS